MPTVGTPESTCLSSAAGSVANRVDAEIKAWESVGTLEPFKKNGTIDEFAFAFHHKSVYPSLASLAFPNMRHSQPSRGLFTLVNNTCMLMEP